MECGPCGSAFGAVPHAAPDRQRVRHRREVERNLLAQLDANETLGTEAIAAYGKLMVALRAETVPLPTPEEVAAHRHLIRHEADVPVLASALKAAPDWLVTTNTRHFTPVISARTGLKMCTPKQLIGSLRIAT